MRKKRHLIYQRRGGPGPGGSGLFFLIGAAACLPFALAISAAFIVVLNEIKTLIKQVIPEYELSAGNSMIIILAEIIALGFGVYLYTSTHTGYSSISPSTLWLIMGEVILITGRFSVGKFITERQKASKALLANFTGVKNSP